LFTGATAPAEEEEYEARVKVALRQILHTLFHFTLFKSIKCKNTSWETFSRFFKGSTGKSKDC
jgi:hypothetical protein